MRLSRFDACRHGSCVSAGLWHDCLLRLRPVQPGADADGLALSPKENAPLPPLGVHTGIRTALDFGTDCVAFAVFYRSFLKLLYL